MMMVNLLYPQTYFQPAELQRKHSFMVLHLPLATNLDFDENLQNFDIHVIYFPAIRM